jgi:hypothetical protein
MLLLLVQVVVSIEDMKHQSSRLPRLFALQRQYSLEDLSIKKP